MSEPERTRSKNIELSCVPCISSLDRLVIFICMGEGTIIIISHSFLHLFQLPVVSWLSSLMLFVPFLRSLVAERTLSVKPYLLVLLHKIMFDFICCRVSLQTTKRL